MRTAQVASMRARVSTQKKLLPKWQRKSSTMNASTWLRAMEEQ
jgi:hypothetical protein